MSKLKKTRLNQMIENALSYEQESRRFNSKKIYIWLKVFIYKPNIYGLTFASKIIACLFIPLIVKSRKLVDVNKINDYVTLTIIDDFNKK